jgi:hypothetical protein
MNRRFRLAITLLAASLVAGCIFFPSAKDRALRKTPSFKDGYADGCAAASTQSSNSREQPYRDKALYDSDAAYRAGWGNGYQTCRPPSDKDVGGLPGANPLLSPVPGR